MYFFVLEFRKLKICMQAPFVIVCTYIYISITLRVLTEQTILLHIRGAYTSKQDSGSRKKTNRFSEAGMWIWNTDPDPDPNPGQRPSPDPDPVPDPDPGLKVT